MGGSNCDSKTSGVPNMMPTASSTYWRLASRIPATRVLSIRWVLTRFFGIWNSDTPRRWLRRLWQFCFWWFLAEKRRFCWWFLLIFTMKLEGFQKIAKRIVMRRENSASLAMPTWQNMSLSQFYRCQQFVSGISPFQKDLMDVRSWFTWNDTLDLPPPATNSDRWRFIGTSS